MRHIVLKSPFNRGIISKLGMARADLPEDRYVLSAEVQENWAPRFLGSMMLRPGLAYKGATRSNNFAYHVPFVFSNSDTAILEFTGEHLRVRVDEAIITRGSVSTAITNGTFGSDVSGWTDDDQVGCTSSWASGGYMSLVGTGFNYAIMRQLVSVILADQNDEHALRIVVARGKVTVKVGSTSGNDDYFGYTLAEGTHSIAFTPTGDFYVEVSSNTEYATLLDSITIEASGDLDLPSPYVEADLDLIRYEQSADVIYLWCGEYDTDDKISAAYQTYKIERRATRSWSIVKYLPEDGPWRVINISNNSLTPSALTGDITLTASQNLFTSGNAGSLYKLTSIGQKVEIDVTAENQFSSYIRVIGVDNSRQFTINIAGTWSATVTLQRSVEEPGAWVDVVTYTTNQSAITYDDGLDNQITYYRIGVKTGGFTSGTAEMYLSYASGGITGVARVTEVTGATTANAIVLKDLGGTTGTLDWYEGEWSTRRGFPSSGCLYEGRLFHGGRGKIIGSVSDAYESFDDEIEGDSRPITRTIGRGAVDNIHWLCPSSRLVLGGEGAEWVARSSSLDVSLTQDNINIKDPSNQGSAPIQSLKVDNAIMYVQKSGIRLYATSYDFGSDDYKPNDLSSLVPELHESGIKRLAVQRQPDTRIHVVLEDGTVAMMIFDSYDGSKGWVKITTDGDIEDVVVMPGTTEDYVYYTVKRVINGSTVRYFERWAFESECSGSSFVYGGTSSTTIPNATQLASGTTLPYKDGTVVTARDSSGVKIGNYTVTDGIVTLGAAVTYATLTPSLYKLGDSYVIYDGTAATSIPVAHLEGESVVAWADGLYAGTFTVSSGVITLPTAAQKVMVGLPYKGRYKSNKLVVPERTSLSFNQKHIVNHIGVMLRDTHASGLRYGDAFDNLDDLPLEEMGTGVDEDFVWPEYAEEYFEFDGTWSTDSRVCLEASAPKPCNLLGLMISLRVNEKGSKDDS